MLKKYNIERLVKSTCEKELVQIEEGLDKIMGGEIPPRYTNPSFRADFSIRFLVNECNEYVANNKTKLISKYLENFGYHIVGNNVTVYDDDNEIMATIYFKW